MVNVSLTNEELEALSFVSGYYIGSHDRNEPISIHLQRAVKKFNIASIKAGHG